MGQFLEVINQFTQFLLNNPLIAFIIAIATLIGSVQTVRDAIKWLWDSLSRLGNRWTWPQRPNSRFLAVCLYMLFPLISSLLFGAVIIALLNVLPLPLRKLNDTDLWFNVTLIVGIGMTIWIYFCYTVVFFAKNNKSKLYSACETTPLILVFPLCATGLLGIVLIFFSSDVGLTLFTIAGLGCLLLLFPLSLVDYSRAVSSPDQLPKIVWRWPKTHSTLFVVCWYILFPLLPASISGIGSIFFIELMLGLFVLLPIATFTGININTIFNNISFSTHFGYFLVACCLLTCIGVYISYIVTFFSERPSSGQQRRIQVVCEAILSFQVGLFLGFVALLWIVFPGLNWFSIGITVCCIAILAPSYVLLRKYLF